MSDVTAVAPVETVGVTMFAGSALYDFTQSKDTPVTDTSFEALYRTVSLPRRSSDARWERTISAMRVRPYDVDVDPMVKPHDSLYRTAADDTWIALPYDGTADCSGLSVWNTPDRRSPCDWLIRDTSPAAATEAGVLAMTCPAHGCITWDDKTQQLRRFACYELAPGTRLPPGFLLCVNNRPAEGHRNIVPFKEVVLSIDSKSQAFAPSIDNLPWIYVGAYLLPKDRQQLSMLRAAAEPTPAPPSPRDDEGVKELLCHLSEYYDSGHCIDLLLETVLLRDWILYDTDPALSLNALMDILTPAQRQTVITVLDELYHNSDSVDVCMSATQLRERIQSILSGDHTFSGYRAGWYGSHEQ